MAIESHPEDNAVFSSASLFFGMLFTTLGVITSANMEYLFTATIPLITLGAVFFYLGKHFWAKPVVHGKLALYTSTSQPRLTFS